LSSLLACHPQPPHLWPAAESATASPASLPCPHCPSVTRSYLTYGPLLNRASSLVFEGVPTYPTPARCWEVIDKFQVREAAELM